MKNLFKMLFAGFVLVGLGTSAYAQNSDNDAASVTATLLTAVNVTKVTDISFGQVASGTTPSMIATSAVKNNVGSAATLGKFTVTATAGSTIKLTFAAVQLDHSLGASHGSLTFNPTLAQTELTAATFGANLITTGFTYTVNSSGTGAVAGTDHLFIGGTLNAVGTSNPIPALGAGLETGVYTGSLVVTATYN